MSLRLQHAVHCADVVNALKVSMGRRETLTKTPLERDIECHASSVAMPWMLLGRPDRSFSQKYHGFLAISRRCGKLNNSVPMQLKCGLVWQGLYICAPLLLNLLDSLRKRYKMLDKPHSLSLFHNSINSVKHNHSCKIYAHLVYAY